MRGDTSLASQGYDQWLAINKKERDLAIRKSERRDALKKDGSGWLFNIDKKPVKVQGFDHVRQELDKRGLAIKGEYTGKRGQCG